MDGAFGPFKARRPPGWLGFAAKLRQTVQTAIRMLDNVIDINYYSVPQARRSNLKHRPIGLGIMGFQDALYQLRIPYASQEAVGVGILRPNLVR